LNKAGISVSASLSVFFEQTPVANWDKVRSEGGSGGRSQQMSKADRFRQYADEAMRWARQSKTENAKQVLIELAHHPVAQRLAAYFHEPLNAASISTGPSFSQADQSRLRPLPAP
jgi:hypothetical protein